MDTRSLAALRAVLGRLEASPRVIVTKPPTRDGPSAYAVIVTPEERAALADLYREAMADAKGTEG